MEAFKRTTRIAHYVDEKRGRVPVYAFIAWDGDKLSISGVEGPKANGDAVGSCGQINMSEWTEYEAEPGVDLAKLRAVWNAWHLNDMRAGCAHQRAEGWGNGPKVEICTYQLTSDALGEQIRIKQRSEKRLLAGETVTLSADDRAVASLPFQVNRAPDADGAASQRYNVKSREMKDPGWLNPDEHPAGILGKPCPVCGYRYGTAWLKEPVPADVLEWLRALPDNAGACPTRWLRDA